MMPKKKMISETLSWVGMIGPILGLIIMFVGAFALRDFIITSSGYGFLVISPMIGMIGIDLEG